MSQPQKGLLLVVLIVVAVLAWVGTLGGWRAGSLAIAAFILLAFPLATWLAVRRK